MTFEDVRIDVKGFGVDSHFERFLKPLVYDLHLDAPSDSTTTASFTINNSHVTGAIQISSLNGVFSARSSGTNPRHVAKTIVRDIRKQIREWKILRWKSSKALHRGHQLLS
jgi:hypothetical protein